MNKMELNPGQNIEADYKEIIRGNIRKLTDEEIKEHIEEYLASHVICSLATCSGNIPRSTVVRYGSRGLTIYILTEGGGKIKNIRENPNVSVSVYGDYTGFISVNGLQIWGTASIINPDNSKEYQEVLDVLKLNEREDLKEIGAADLKIKMHAIKIDIKKARYLNLPEGIINRTLEVE